jgi:hypothetical protein
MLKVIGLGGSNCDVVYCHSGDEERHKSILSCRLVKDNCSEETDVPVSGPIVFGYEIRPSREQIRFKRGNRASEVPSQGGKVAGLPDCTLAHRTITIP